MPVAVLERSCPARWPLMAAMILAIAGCGAAPGPARLDPDPAGEPVVASTQRDGVVVMLTASTDRIASLGVVELRVEIINASLETVAWRSGGCELLDDFRVLSPPVPQPPAGRAFPGTADLAKFSATSGGVSIDLVRAGPAQPIVVGCPADLRFEDIEPGATLSIDAAWVARTTDGAPAPPGDYRIAFAFPWVARGRADALPPEPPPARPIPLEVSVKVVGKPFAGIASTLAVDAALADPRVADWVSRHLPKERLDGAEIRLVEGRWQFTIFVDGDRSTIALVDPDTAAVVDVRLAD